MERFGITLERLRAGVVENPPEHDAVLRYEPDDLGMAMRRLSRERRSAAARVVATLAEETVTITVTTAHEAYTITFPNSQGAKEGDSPEL